MPPRKRATLRRTFKPSPPPPPNLIVPTVIVFVAVVVTAVMFAWAVWPKAQPAPKTGNTLACTEEAYVCPGGAVVGRVPPACAFAPCPLPEEPEPVAPTNSPQPE